MVLKSCLVFIAAFLLYHSGYTQESRRYSFTHYGIKNGLSAYHVNHVLQDEQGFIWIATFDGLQRFDGIRFLTFRHNKKDAFSIPDNQVVQLLLDKKNNLWVLTADGSIGIFDTKKLIYKNIPVKASNPAAIKGERSLMMDSKGNLIYVLVLEEVLVYDERANEFRAQNKIFQTPPGWKIINVVEDIPGKKYWISSDSGIAVYNKLSGKLSYRNHNAERNIIIERYGSQYHACVFLVDSKQRIWFEQWEPSSGAPLLYAYDIPGRKPLFEQYNLIPLLKRYIEPRWMIEQSDGSIWLSGLGVFLKYLENENSFQPVYNKYENEQSIYYEAVHHLFEDKEHNIWVPTSNNGLYVFNPSEQLFTSVPHINRITKTPGGGGLMSFLQLNSGDILAGTWGDGIYRYDSNLALKPLGIKGIKEDVGYSAWTMCAMKDKHTVWIGLQPGLMIYDQLTETGKLYNPAPLHGRTVRQITEDRLGNIWLGTHGAGVFKWLPAKGNKKFEDGFVKVNDIPNTVIERVTTDSKGFIWIGTINKGVYKIDPGTDSVIEHINSGGPAQKRLTGDGVADAFEYNDSIMIFITGSLNVFNQRSNVISAITSSEGLPSDMVMCMQKDTVGSLWLGMYNGLCKMNLEKRTFIYYDRNDGMLNDNFDVSGSYKLRDGRMIFATGNYFIVFNPATVRPNLHPKNVVITDLRLMNRPLSVDSVLHLKHLELMPDENSLIISFAGLSYYSRNKLTYSYMMEGIDKEWKKANILNQVVYNYLPPGEYMFSVKAENADGVASNITSFKIRVKPPFWQTPWFIGLIAFISLAVLYWIDKFRMERVVDNQRTRTSIATSLTKDMSSTLSSINVLSEMAKLKAASDIERTKDYVSQISENSNRMIEVMDDMVWSINPENDSMQNIIERMKKYAAEIQRRFNIEITFNADPALNGKRLVMDRRHELFLIFKEAVFNIAKHSNSRFADIDIHYIKSKIILQIMDDGKGFDTESVIYGRGLNEIRKRAAALNAKLDIVSKLNNGTVVRLEIAL